MGNGLCLCEMPHIMGPLSVRVNDWMLQTGGRTTMKILKARSKTCVNASLSTTKSVRSIQTALKANQCICGKKSATYPPTMVRTMVTFRWEQEMDRIGTGSDLYKPCRIFCSFWHSQGTDLRNLIWGGDKLNVVGLFLQPTLMHNSITHVCHITILVMFRALTCPSSGGTTAQTQRLESSLS